MIQTFSITTALNATRAQEKASGEELFEALKVALAVGGSITILQIRQAIDAPD